MGNKDEPKFEEEELDAVEDFDDDASFDESSEDPVELTNDDVSEEERRIKARREIERRNELKALQSELDEWDDMPDDDEL